MRQAHNAGGICAGEAYGRGTVNRDRNVKPSSVMSTATALSTVQEIAQDLVALCRDGNWSEPVVKYYAKDIVSVEAAGPDRESVGVEAVKAKGAWWMENHDVHSTQVEGPYVGGDKFVVRFTMDVTFKPTGQRRTLDELGIYTVADGKIVHEQFFYNAQ